MMVRRFLALLLLLTVSGVSRADEGMWLLNKIKHQQIDTMQAMGLELSADDIYADDGTSLKDAIVRIGGGCTAELISDQGLILTNHHCGYSQIQYHSSVEHDYLKNGFWAMSKNEELYCPDYPVWFLIDMVDVTDSVNAGVDDELDPIEKQVLLDNVFTRIEKSVSDTSHFEGQVKSYYGGNMYYLLIYEVFTDVRFVGAPPFAIGKFGADTDNWMWPRHTGDFSLFRVYCGADGKPAEYAQENIPYKPKHYLPISLKGYEKDDFTMILGYPGRTQRFYASPEINLLKTTTLPVSVDIRETRQNIMFEDMQKDEKVNIQYSEKFYMRSSNYWKFFTGQLHGIDKLNIIERKEAFENEFMQWVKDTQPPVNKYNTVLESIDSLTNELEEIDHTIRYFTQGIYYGIEFVGVNRDFYNRIKRLNGLEAGTEQFLDVKENLIKDINNFFKDYNPPTDEKMAIALLDKFKENVEPQYHPDVYAVINNKYRGQTERFVHKLFDKSVFVNQAKLLEAIEDQNLKKLQKDMAYVFSNDIYTSYFNVYARYRDLRNKLDDQSKIYIQGLLQMDSTRFAYPDANFTMRLTYGTVQDIYPADAVYYDYRTTLKGVMEKKDQSSWEFKVPQKLIDLYNTKDYGSYGVNDTMYTCFITNNDITGGNSGSPVLNNKGELIGLAFDGNWEAMTGDLIYEPGLQRCINVDIRYVLFIIDKFAGAAHLIDEMDLRY